MNSTIFYDHITLTPNKHFHESKYLFNKIFEMCKSNLQNVETDRCANSVSISCKIVPVLTIKPDTDRDYRRINRKDNRSNVIRYEQIP